MENKPTRTLNSQVLGKEKDEVAKMFDDIAPKYDRLNRILSFRSDVRWRKKLVKSIASYNPQLILDLASGTGDLAIELLALHPKKIILADISDGMLELAKKKTSKIKNTIFEFQNFSAEKIPIESNSIDAVTIGFGIRNFENPSLALDEIYRVLKNEGVLSILEFGIPANPCFRFIYKIYQRFILAPLGRIISGHHSAYSYLKKSTSHFPYGEEFVTICETSGFKLRKIKKLQGGIAYMYVYTKSILSTF